MNRFIIGMGCALAVPAAAIAQTASAPKNPPANSAAHGLARSLSSAFADVYEKIAPGVVVIESQPSNPVAGYATGSPLGQLFQGDPRFRGPDSDEMNQGSGFIITADGYILTNNHVLEGAESDGVRVILKDGRKFPAQIIGEDPISDLAVIKIKAASLPVVELGDSDKMRVGEFAFALGAPFDLRDTFTYGIISAKGRTDIEPGNPDYQEYLQTDAAINPGNSGGPLVNIDGQVIGVNTLIRDLNRGLGFAIPINIAKKVATQLIAEGRAVRPWLGVAIMSSEDLPRIAPRNPYISEYLRRNRNVPAGILVTAIEAGAPASNSDLRAFDLITSVDGQPVTNSRELQKAILGKGVGDEVELSVWRGSAGLVTVKLRTAERSTGYFPVANQRRNPAMTDEDAADDQNNVDDATPTDDPKAQPIPNAPPAPSAQTLPPTKAPTGRSATAGLMVRTLTADAAVAMNLQPEEGVLVTSVQPGSASAAAGVRVGDVITAVGSAAVRTKEDFLDALQQSGDDALMLNLNRGNEKTYGILKY